MSNKTIDKTAKEFETITIEEGIIASCIEAKSLLPVLNNLYEKAFENGKRAGLRQARENAKKNTLDERQKKLIKAWFDCKEKAQFIAKKTGIKLTLVEEYIKTLPK